MGGSKRRVRPTHPVSIEPSRVGTFFVPTAENITTIIGADLKISQKLGADHHTCGNVSAPLTNPHGFSRFTWNRRPSSPDEMHIRGRVENRTGSRLPSLIKPCMRFSRTRLSDALHTKACTLAYPVSRKCTGFSVANRASAAATSAMTGVQPPVSVWRNNRITPGYQGVSLRPVSQRQSVL